MLFTNCIYNDLLIQKAIAFDFYTAAPWSPDQRVYNAHRV